jgi:hypothetical protein
MSFKDNMTDAEIISLALKMILDNLEASNYTPRMKWEMTLRINRMLAGCHYDPNPEAEKLDYNIYKLGLTLLLQSSYSSNIKRRAEYDIFPKFLSLKDGDS